jgi:hypothetical protein
VKETVAEVNGSESEDLENELSVRADDMVAAASSNFQRLGGGESFEAMMNRIAEDTCLA